MVAIRGFAAGAGPERERQHRGRMDLMRGFQEFQRNNPYATAADYQAFIDQASGMDNYLRGGMPGPEVLQRLEQQNLERKRRDTVQANLQEMQQRAQTMGQMEAIASQFIDNNDDLNQAYNQFVQAMGGHERLQGMDFQQFFTPQYRERRDAQRTAELLPVVVEMMDHTGGHASASEIAQKLGVTPRMAEILRERAAQRFERTQNERLIRDHQVFIDFLISGMSQGYDTSGLVEQLAHDTGIDPKRFAPLVESARQRMEEQTRARRGEQIETALRRVEDGARLRIAHVDPEEGKKMLREHLEIFGDVDLDDDAINAIYRRLMGDHEATLRLRHEEARLNLPQSMTEHVEAVQEESRALITELVPDGNLRSILRDLSRSHDIRNAETILEMVQQFGTNPDALRTREAIVQSGRFPTLQSVRDGYIANFEAANPQPQRFSEWVRDQRYEIDDSVRQMESAIEQFASQAPELRIDPETVQRVTAGTRALYDNMIQQLHQARSNRDRWMLPSEEFNDSEFSKLVSHLEMKRDEHLRRIEESVQSAQEMFSQPEEPEPESLPPPAQPGQPRAPTESLGGRSRRGPEEPVPFRETPGGQQLWDWFSTDQQPRRGTGRGQHLRE